MTSLQGRQAIIIPAVAATVFLLAALINWPYGYYTLLRWVVCVSSVVIAYHAHASGSSWAVWLFGFLAILFNPIAPIHLSREVWTLIDLASAATFMVAAFTVRPLRQDRSNEERPGPTDQGWSGTGTAST